VSLFHLALEKPPGELFSEDFQKSAGAFSIRFALMRVEADC
jgi:hypothetical protein